MLTVKQTKTSRVMRGIGEDGEEDGAAEVSMMRVVSLMMERVPPRLIIYIQ